MSPSCGPPANRRPQPDAAGPERRRKGARPASGSPRPASEPASPRRAHRPYPGDAHGGARNARQERQQRRRRHSRRLRRRRCRRRRCRRRRRTNRTDTPTHCLVCSLAMRSSPKVAQKAKRGAVGDTVAPTQGSFSPSSAETTGQWPTPGKVGVKQSRLNSPNIGSTWAHNLSYEIDARRDCTMHFVMCKLFASSQLIFA